jgi:hypothetical protein
MGIPLRRVIHSWTLGRKRLEVLECGHRYERHLTGSVPSQRRQCFKCVGEAAQRQQRADCS